MIRAEITPQGEPDERVPSQGPRVVSLDRSTIPQSFAGHWAEVNNTVLEARMQPFVRPVAELAQMPSAEDASLLNSRLSRIFDFLKPASPAVAAMVFLEACNASAPAPIVRPVSPSPSEVGAPIAIVASPTPEPSKAATPKATETPTQTPIVTAPPTESPVVTAVPTAAPTASPTEAPTPAIKPEASPAKSIATILDSKPSKKIDSNDVKDSLIKAYKSNALSQGEYTLDDLMTVWDNCQNVNGRQGDPYLNLEESNRSLIIGLLNNYNATNNINTYVAANKVFIYAETTLPDLYKKHLVKFVKDYFGLE